jgi:hypothetical protein
VPLPGRIAYRAQHDVRTEPAARAGRAARVAFSALILLLAAGAAVLGFSLARHGSASPRPGPVDRTAISGPLELTYASVWRPATSPEPARLGLVDAVVLAFSDGTGRMLIVGRLAAPNGEVLPRALVGSLSSASVPVTIALGSYEFYRYANVVPPGGSGTESVYAMPTTVGTVLGLCLAPVSSASFAGACERTIGTLRLSSGRVLYLGPTAGYASALNTAIQRLNVRRAALAARLSTGSSSVAQADAASALAGAYTRAASTLSGLAPGSTGSANQSVVAALRGNAGAYTALARAAAAHDRPAYAAAAQALQRAAGALHSAYDVLVSDGYRLN